MTAIFPARTVSPYHYTPANNLPRVSRQHNQATSSRECRECWSLILGLRSTTSTTPSSIVNVRTLRIQPLCDQILLREVKEHRDLRYGSKRKACKVDGYLRTGRKWGKSIRSNARIDSRSILEFRMAVEKRTNVAKSKTQIILTA